MKIIKNIIPQSIKNIYHAFSAILAVIYYRYPAKDLTVIGITGTDGKTTTSSMIYHILRFSGKKTALISTVAAYIGDKIVNTGFHTTTPNEWALQKLLKDIRSRGINYVVLESTSIGLDQYRLLGTNIKYAVYTNITHEHLDYHRTFKAYVAAKAKLIQYAHTIVLNTDNDSYNNLKSFIKPPVKILLYSLNKYPRTNQLKKIFPSKHNQENALAALTLIKSLNITETQALKSLEDYPGVPGRLEYVKNSRGLTITVDYAHTPNALKQVLTHLKAQAGKHKLIAVFGATGRRDYKKRPIMGNIASRLADEVVLTSDDSYDEDVNSIIQQIKQGVKVNYGHVHSIPNRQKAIAFALNKLADKGDTIAVLGIGHQQTINMDGRTETPWNEISIIKQMLSDRK